MILGTGIDIVEIERIKLTITKWGSRFLNKVFTDNEIAYCNSKADPAQHFAVRFAAKEAFYKALPQNREYTFSWKDIEVISEKSGNPLLKTSGISGRLGDISVHLSLSHSKESAVAVVIIENI